MLFHFELAPSLRVLAYLRVRRYDRSPRVSASSTMLGSICIPPMSHCLDFVLCEPKSWWTYEVGCGRMRSFSGLMSSAASELDRNSAKLPNILSGDEHGRE